jgi:hypothetical protein
MKSLAHNPQLLARFSALRRSVSPSPLDTFFMPQSRFRFKRHFALAHARRLFRHGPRPPDNFYKSLLLQRLPSDGFFERDAYTFFRLEHSSRRRVRKSTSVIRR